MSLHLFIYKIMYIYNLIDILLNQINICMSSSHTCIGPNLFSGQDPKRLCCSKEMTSCRASRMDAQDSARSSCNNKNSPAYANCAPEASFLHHKKKMRSELMLKILRYSYETTYKGKFPSLALYAPTLHSKGSYRVPNPIGMRFLCFSP
jgi:hypothetical protein